MPDAPEDQLCDNIEIRGIPGMHVTLEITARCRGMFY